jgi:biopolymer transport protein ExbD
MAEVAQDSGGGSKKGGKVRSKKMSTKIDFTPMVDLGFLLITFFMLTTTLAKPQIMPITMPDNDELKEDEVDKVNPDMVITLLLGGGDKVYYYEGIENPKLDSTDYSDTGLRQVLLAKRERTNRSFGTREEDVKKDGEVVGKKNVTKMIVLIKPAKESRYKNLVDTFDEMEICEIPARVLVEISDKEVDFIKNPAGGLKFSVQDQVEAASSK